VTPGAATSTRRSTCGIVCGAAGRGDGRRSAVQLPASATCTRAPTCGTGCRRAAAAPHGRRLWRVWATGC